MSMHSLRSRTGDRRKPVVAGVAALLIVALLSVAGPASPVDASAKYRIGDQARFEDGSAASGVQADLFEAQNRWQRGAYLRSTSTSRDGIYDFDVDRGCYFVVFIAPLGSEFGSVGSGQVYDQRYICVDNDDRLDVDTVLYRGTTEPPPPEEPWERIELWCGMAGGAPEGRRFNLSEKVADRFTHVYKLDESYFDDFKLILGGIDVTDTFFYPDVSREYDLRMWAVENPWGTSYDAPRGGVDLELVDISGAKEDRSYTVRCSTYSPIALDVDGSGAVERVDAEVAFDFNADGEDETVSEWFAPTEGILFDSRVPGPLTGAHLFGDQGGLYADGFEKLALLDLDGSGFVEGAELDGLAVWVDGNTNGLVDAGEVSSLADHQVAALSTEHSNFVSEARLADGSTMVTEDLWFPMAPVAAGNSPLSMIGLGLAALGLIGWSVAAARRRRDGLDQELIELTNHTSVVST